jgi:hypothetical protein
MGEHHEPSKRGWTFILESTHPFSNLEGNSEPGSSIVRGIINEIARNVERVTSDINESLEYDSDAYSLTIRAASRDYSDVASTDIGYTVVIEVLPRRFVCPASSVPRNTGRN